MKKMVSDLAHLNEMKVRYDISKLQKEMEEGDSFENITGRLPPPGNSNAHESPINKEKREILTGWLTDGQLALKVISVNGMAGVGKTFMVHEVYSSKTADSHFDCKAWVTISNSYRMEHVLTTIYKDLLGKKGEHMDDTSQSDVKGLEDNISRFVQGKNYMIILDDVWNPQAYYDVKRALPDNEHGSRIVITTHLDEVAKLANEGYRMMLDKLDNIEAWKLFCQEAFSRDKEKKCPAELEKIGNTIVYKCEGLPLAIVAIARLLSLKRKTQSEWKRFYEKLSWEFANNQSLKDVERVVMNTSYNDLPSYLKNCFLFCSIFPDYEITRNKLIRLWIAESFIQARGTHTMEDVAEEFLDELIHRSVMYVVERNSFGKVKRCRMHNLVRDLTLERARKDNFSFVWKESESAPSGNGARRLSVHDYSPNSNLSRMDFSGTRSLLMFGGAVPPLLETISCRAKYLRVVDLEAAEIERMPDAFMNLFNLHFLGLRYTNIKLLPDSIRRLRNLQTLDLRCTKIEKLPKGINQLKNVRHLLTLNENYTDHHLDSIRCAEAPKGIWKLTSLQQIDMVVDEASVGRLWNLSQLRTIRLSKVKKAHCQELTTSISQMPALRTLWMIAKNKNEVLQLQDLGEILPNLQKLRLYGRLLAPAVVDVPRRHGRRFGVRFKARVRVAALLITGVISRITAVWRRRSRDGRGMTRDASDHVPYSKLKWQVFDKLRGNLRVLHLSWSGLREDPLPELGKLGQLTVLNLRGAYDGVLLCFKKGWFLQLKELHLLHLPNLRKIIFERGSLPSLQNLEMEGLLELADIPQGIEHLTSMRHMDLSECHPIFHHEIKEDPRGRVAHIAGISYWHRVDGIWNYEDLSRRNAEEQQSLNSQEEITVEEAYENEDMSPLVPKMDSPAQVDDLAPVEVSPTQIFPSSSDVQVSGGDSGHSPCVEPIEQDNRIAILEYELEDEKNKIKLITDLVRFPELACSRFVSMQL